MESKLVRCKSCDHEFRIEYLKRCPSCRAKINAWDFTKSVEVIPEEELAPEEKKEGSGTLQHAKIIAKSLSAEERTTHAVRSIAIFILIQVTSTVIAAIFAGIGIAMDISADGSSGGAAMYVFAVLIAAGGLLAALSSAWSEYSQSS
jgi:hypothetical protein